MRRIIQIGMLFAGKPGMFVAAWVVAVMLFAGLLPHRAYAHGSEKHENKRRPDTAMQHVHGLMSVYEDCLSRISDALKIEDKDVLLREGERLLAASRELNNANPYKQGKQAKVFKKHSQKFEQDTAGLVASITQGNIEKSAMMFKQVEQKCLSCHAVFN